MATMEPANLTELIACANKLDVSVNDPTLGIGRGTARAHQGGNGGGRDPYAMDVDTTSTGRAGSTSAGRTKRSFYEE